MAVGTSLGAFYDSAFEHHAGVLAPSKEASKDDNSYTVEGDQNDKGSFSPKEVSDKTGGTYIGELGADEDLSYDSSVPIGRRNGDKIDLHSDPAEVMKTLPKDSEGYTLPGNPSLWIRKKKELVPMSSNELPIVPVSQTTSTADTVEKELPDVGDAPFGGDNLEPIAKFGDALFGRGRERLQLWPEKMVRGAFDSVQKVMNGDVPMWSADPGTGEFHTSIEGLEAAHSLIPFAIGGGIPTRIRLRPEPEAPVTPEPTLEDMPHLQEALARIRRQPSNIEPAQQPRIEGDRAIWEPTVRHVEDDGLGGNPELFSPAERIEMESVVNPHADPEWQHPMSGEEAANHYHNLHAQRGSRDAIRFAHEYEETSSPAQWDQYERLVNDPYRQTPFRNLDEPSFTEHDLHEQNLSSYSERVSKEIRQRFETNKDLVEKKGNLSLLEGQTSRKDHVNYNFMNDQGKVGDLSITFRRGGRELHVDWIGTPEPDGMNTIGRKEIRNLVNLLKDKYPDAVEMTGFRVSGVRAKTGGGPNNARMRLRKDETKYLPPDDGNDWGPLPYPE